MLENDEEGKGNVKGKKGQEGQEEAKTAMTRKKTTSTTTKTMLKIAVNGNGENSGKGKWRKVLKEIDHFMRLFKGETDTFPVGRWKKYKKGLTYESIKKDVEELELTTYFFHISLVDKFKKELPHKLLQFEENVLKKDYMMDEVDFILSTVHSAKGMEWDNCLILDVFSPLNLFSMYFPKRPRWKKASSFGSPAKDKTRPQFAHRSFGYDLNLWYVAVTRAKKRLFVNVDFGLLLTDLSLIDLAAASTSKSEWNKRSIFLLHGKGVKEWKGRDLLSLHKNVTPWIFEAGEEDDLLVDGKRPGKAEWPVKDPKGRREALEKVNAKRKERFFANSQNF